MNDRLDKLRNNELVRNLLIKGKQLFKFKFKTRPRPNTKIILLKIIKKQ